MPVIIENKLATFTNETLTKLQAMDDLITQYIGVFKAVYHGHRPISAGQERLVFPCVMIEPISDTQEMISTAKTDWTGTYELWFYFVNNSRDGLVEMQTSGMNALLKLFSNNALGDLMTASKSDQFKIYSGYWYDSNIRNIQYSPTFSFQWADKATYCRAGRFTIEVKDRIIR
jgi:hypothetical protein